MDDRRFTPEDHDPAPIDAALAARARAVRLLTCDVDGVLTDGRIHVDDDGRESKAFHAHDGVGLKRLMAAGVAVAWITGSASSSVVHRARALGVVHLVRGTDDKLPHWERLRADLGVESFDQLGERGHRRGRCHLSKPSCSRCHDRILHGKTPRVEVYFASEAPRRSCPRLRGASSGSTHHPLRPRPFLVTVSSDVRGLVVSVSLSSSPRARRVSPANAIIAALSVQARKAGTTTRSPAFSPAA